MSANPTIARRRLGIKLRELREARSARLEDVAARLGVAASTLSRIETGKAPTRLCYLTTMLNVYGVSDPGLRKPLADLAREGQRKAWWTPWADLLPDGAGRYLGMESAASLVRSYATRTVPALLQTTRYARAVCQATWPRLTADQIRALVKITMRRQEIMQRNSTHVHVVLDESVLLRTIAPADVMVAQLGHLRAVAARSTVTLQIAALSRQLPALSPPFTMISFADLGDADVAVSYGPGEQVIISTRDNEVVAMADTFKTLAQAALSPADSKTMISDILDKLCDGPMS